MKIIRPGGLVAVIVIAAAVSLFAVFMADSLVKKVIESAGRSVFKAKVELQKADISFMKSSLKLEGLTIADKDSEFRNLFEAGVITLDFQLLQALKKRVIIDKIEMTNSATGTKRVTSGFLPPSELKKIEKREKEAKPSLLSKLTDNASKKAKNEIASLPVTKMAGKVSDLTKTDFSKAFKKEDLESYKTIMSAGSKITSGKEEIESMVKKADFEKRSASVKTTAESLKSFKVSGVQDIPAAQEKLKELDKARLEIDSMKRDADAISKAASAYSSLPTSLEKEINAAIDRDTAAMIAKADIGIIDAKSIESALLGPVWSSRLAKMMQLISMADKYIPSGKKAKKDKKNLQKRAKGTDVIFTADNNPSFLIKELVISSKTAADSGLAISGTGRDIAIEQYITGKPSLLSIKAVSGKKNFSLDAKIDRVNETNDSYTLAAAGLSMEEIGMDKPNLGNVKMDSALVGSSLKADVKENSLKIAGTVSLGSIIFAAADKQDIVYTVLSNIGSIGVKIESLTSEKESYLNVSSDAFDKIKTALSKVYGKKIEEAKAQAKKEVEKMIAAEKAAFTKSASESVKSALSSSGGADASIKSALSSIDGAKGELTKKIAEAQAGGLKNLFK